MRTLLLVLALTASACKSTGSECKRYVKAQNSCSNELNDVGVTISPLSAGLLCSTLNLPGIASADLKEEFSCLADIYANADCSSQEAFSESVNTSTCGVDDDTDDTDSDPVDTDND